MAGKRKPNPIHITRYEHESYGETDAKGRPWRSSNYDHGIKVPDEHVDEIRRSGFVRIERTNAEEWGELLAAHDADPSAYRWTTEYRAAIERRAAKPGLYSMTTYTIGHIVWPDGDGDHADCDECPGA